MLSIEKYIFAVLVIFILKLSGPEQSVDLASVSPSGEDSGNFNDDIPIANQSDKDSGNGYNESSLADFLKKYYYNSNPETNNDSDESSGETSGESMATGENRGMAENDAKSENEMNETSETSGKDSEKDDESQGTSVENINSSEAAGSDESSEGIQGENDAETDDGEDRQINKSENPETGANEDYSDAQEDAGSVESGNSGTGDGTETSTGGAADSENGDEESDELNEPENSDAGEGADSNKSENSDTGEGADSNDSENSGTDDGTETSTAEAADSENSEKSGSSSSAESSESGSESGGGGGNESSSSSSKNSISSLFGGISKTIKKAISAVNNKMTGLEDFLNGADNNLKNVVYSTINITAIPEEQVVKLFENIISVINVYFKKAIIGAHKIVLNIGHGLETLEAKGTSCFNQNSKDIPKFVVKNAVSCLTNKFSQLIGIANSGMNDVMMVTNLIKDDLSKIGSCKKRLKCFGGIGVSTGKTLGGTVFSVIKTVATIGMTAGTLAPSIPVCFATAIGGKTPLELVTIGFHTGQCVIQSKM